MVGCGRKMENSYRRRRTMENDHGGGERRGRVHVCRGTANRGR